MKDPAHHMKSVQREILRSSRREAEQDSLFNHQASSPKETSFLVSRDNNDKRTDFDGKRRTLSHRSLTSQTQYQNFH